MIEIIPDGDVWAVELRTERLATFDSQAPAVSFACKLAERISMNGHRPRIRVQFKTAQPSGDAER